jgi:hypothetical protein
MKIVALIIGAAAVLAASTAPAVTPATTTTVVGGYGMPGDYGDYFYPDRATTPGEGFDYGLARIIRAEGEYNLNTSKGWINFTEAQRREMENLQKWTETYFDMRRMNREMRAVERGRRPSDADFVRYAQIGKPRRLSPSDLDAITGQIAWPLLLRTPEFAAQRTAVEQAFMHRASNGVIDVAEYLEVYQLTALMMDSLKAVIRDVPTYDYLIARRFLESLAYEARLPVG